MTGPVTRWRARARRVVPWVLVAALAFGAGMLARGAGRPAEHVHPPAGTADAATVWTCSMHPQIRRNEPGQCPICGMDLIPASGASEASTRPERVTLSDRAQALSRLRTTEVRRREGSAVDVRLLGRVEPQESAARTVTAWVGGRIDRLHVRVTGQRVSAGQVIATLYSPEVYAAHQDLLSAKRQLARMAAASPIARTAAEAALGAARDRLRLLGVRDAELTRMEGADQPTRQVAIRTPFGGTVMERLATEGAYVTTGAPLYRLADLSRVWVQLDAYESDLSSVATGQSVRLEVESLPGETFEGRVAFIDPTIDPRRRTARVRVEVSNRGGRLRPGMFAEAVVAAGGRAGEQAPLVIPDSAPLFTGRRAVVYVEVQQQDRPTYEARVVRLGPRMGGVYPVVAGLSEGDRVVTRGAFVLDADLQIRGGASMMSAPDDTQPGPWDEAITLPAAARSALAPLLASYLDLGAALAADDLARARSAAGSLVAQVGSTELTEPAEASQVWARVRPDLRQHGSQVAAATTLETARSAFEPLSHDVQVLVRRFGNPLGEPVNLAFCPMAFGSRGAEWLQRGTAIDNAYFGAAMRSCGEIRATVGPGGFLGAPAEPGAPAAPAAGHSH